VVDLEQVGDEPVALGDPARFADHRRRFFVAAADVVPERQVRAPPDLHQRRDRGLGEDRLDPRDERVGGIPFRRPVEIVEQRRGGHHPRVQVGLAIDQLVQAAGGFRELRILGTPEEERDHVGRPRAELALAIELRGLIRPSRRSNSGSQRSSGAKFAHS
jgi:hypothetical protein